jgi:hypothetical protein
MQVMIRLSRSGSGAQDMPTFRPCAALHIHDVMRIKRIGGLHELR